VKRASGNDVQVSFLGSNFQVEVDRAATAPFHDGFPYFSRRCKKNEFKVGVKKAIRICSGQQKINTGLDPEQFAEVQMMMDSFIEQTDKRKFVMGGTHYELGDGTLPENYKDRYKLTLFHSMHYNSSSCFCFFLQTINPAQYFTFTSGLLGFSQCRLTRAAEYANEQLILANLERGGVECSFLSSRRWVEQD
jgi:hypothetical protein